MGVSIRKFWQNLVSRQEPVSLEMLEPLQIETQSAQTLDFDISQDDLLLTYLLNSPGVVEIEKIDLPSPALQFLRSSGVKMLVPLVSQGELIGLLSLGPRRSEQDYSTDDRRLLTTLATQAAPALRVAQLASQQQAEARERERMENELRVARVIQQTLLPKEIPALPSWNMAAHWQPARAVSGDFYDFISFPDGKLGVIVGDVTDKGVPAALVMATTRSLLRTNAERLVSPGLVLEHTNNMLIPNMPPNMFVTCLYALLDPESGKILYANAGHNVPYQRTGDGVIELRARGLPLGLMEDMDYEEKETVLDAGDSVILYSDGLVEAHNPQGEMFGFPRLRDLLFLPVCGNQLIQCMMSELETFTGSDWEQEDDVTFVTIERTGADASAGEPAEASEGFDGVRRLLSRFSLVSQPGNERQAVEQVSAVLRPLGLPVVRLERLETAVAEATMNAMEHGNKYRADLPVEIEVLISDADLVVRVRDFGGNQDIPDSEMPDIYAKLEGLQSPRGWGLFLIKNMVDEMNIITDETHHIMELVLHLKGENDDEQTL